MPFEEKFHLRIPGPTPVPLRVQHAMNRPMIGHRSAECSRLVQKCSQRLQSVFGTRENVLIIAGSGTSALEAAVANTVAPGEEAVVVVTGAFGDRFAKIADRFGARVHRLDIPWGEACSPDALKSFLLSRPRVKAVFLTHCETSTGVLNPVRDLAQIVREHSDALVIVDGVSSVGGVPCEMDAWGIDIFVTGSQKALMLPPRPGLCRRRPPGPESHPSGGGPPLLPGSPGLPRAVGERNHPLHAGDRPPVRAGGRPGHAGRRGP